MVNYYPLNLNLENKKCLVVGAGKVAERKVRRLLECKANVLVISPQLCAGLRILARKEKIAFKNRKVGLRDLGGAFLVIAATADRKTNSFISSFCRRKNILVNVADSPKECNFILPSIIKRGALIISVSTGGISPALSKRIRRDLEARFGSEYARLLSVMKEIRPQALKKIKNSKSRKLFFEKALQPGILNLFKLGKVSLAKRKLKRIFEDAGT